METLSIKGKNFELQDIEKIKVEDYSSYIPGKSSNGGGYITGVTFTDDGNSWTRVDWSSCELLDNEYSESDILEIMNYLNSIDNEPDIEISIYQNDGEIIRLQG